MAIPEHVKKLAMDAVANKETTNWIRQYSNDNAAGQIFNKPKPHDGKISEDMKKRAMDAVAQFRPPGKSAAAGNPESASAKSGAIGVNKSPTQTGQNQKAAMDAPTHKENQTYIHLVSVNRISAPLPTPTRDSMQASGKIAQMQQSGMTADSIHRTATKDGFGRNDGR